MKHYPVLLVITIALLALGFLIVVCLPSLRLAYCDGATLNARQQLAHWLQTPSLPVALEVAQSVETVLSDASQQCANTALYPLELAKFNEWRAKQAYRIPPVRDHFYRRVVVYLHAALKRRPLAADLSASIAQFKAYLGEFDIDYHNSLHNAIRFGLNEPHVQLTALEAALKGWAVLSAKEKKGVIMLYRSARQQEPRTVAVLQQAYAAIGIDKLAAVDYH